MADGLIGIQRTRVYSQAELLAGGLGFTPGKLVRHYDGYQYIFVKAAGTIASGATATVTNGVATAGAGTYTAQAALAAGQFGWLRTNAAQSDNTPDQVVAQDGGVTPVA